MKQIYYLIFLSCMYIGLFSACATKKNYKNPTDYPEAYISFGNGGGISGLVTTYTLLDNGQLLKKMPTQDSFTFVQRIDKKLAKQIFSNYQSLELNKIQHNQPGNMYQFMSFHDKKKEHNITWNNSTLPSDKEKVKTFYNLLRSIAKKSENQ